MVGRGRSPHAESRRVEEFYRSVLGTGRVGGGLEAGWDRPLILMREGEGAPSGGYMYHVAIRVLSR